MLNYALVNSVKEEHGQNIYCVQIYQPFQLDPEHIIFATVGSNRVSIYEYTTQNDQVELADIYVDADPEEDFYTCAWSTDMSTNEPLLAIAGVKGLIRLIVPFKVEFRSFLIGHGSSIHDLRFHPTRVSILLSASRDYTIRLWNIKTNVCVAIFGGAEGHCDEVLSADFNLKATRIMSCSIDHHLKMWSLQTPKIVKALDDSETYSNKNKSFPTVLVNFPDFSTRDIHTNYIDYVRWFGDLVISKSCEECLVLWKPGLVEEKYETLSRASKNVTIYHKFAAKDCDIWYLRFCIDFGQKILAVGTSTGKIHVWDLRTDDTKDFKSTLLTNAKSAKKTIRSVALSMNGQLLVAVSNDGCVFIWRRQ